MRERMRGRDRDRQRKRVCVSVYFMRVCESEKGARQSVHACMCLSVCARARLK